MEIRNKFKGKILTTIKAKDVWNTRFTDEYVNWLEEQLTLTNVVKSLKEVSKIVDKIVEESPLLCMPDDKQMQRDYLKEKWTKWFKKEYKL